MSAHDLLQTAWLVPLLPLAGAVALTAVGGRFLKEPAAGWIATLAMFAAFGWSLVLLGALWSLDAGERVVVDHLFDWIAAGSLDVSASLLIDPLSLTMILFVTGVGALIHLYSIGYMHGDERFSRFFLYLNLFAASMLILVLGGSFPVMFLGWEGVGLCSYLLISFWFERDTAASAGKKAFVTNRIGDFGFLLAMFLVFFHLGTLEIDQALAGAPALAGGTATAIALLFFLGAVGKSAQFPLHVWLPDAMEGPTPVSALIHAATMVTAGVYLVVRVHPFFEVGTAAATTVAWVGVGTAFFAATIALVHNDIKRVLAYSTISQLGYMFLAVGIGAYAAAIFHMVTHAFFKALLFLGAGSVMHGMHDEQDMRRMGGLRKYMPWTAGTFIVAWLAIAGVVPLAGFWSKDEILAKAWFADEHALWAIGAVTALLTALYMTRQVWMVFFSTERWREPAAVGATAGATASAGASGVVAEGGGTSSSSDPPSSGAEASSSPDSGRESSSEPPPSSATSGAEEGPASAAGGEGSEDDLRDSSPGDSPGEESTPEDEEGSPPAAGTGTGAEGGVEEPHESPRVMLVPLVALAGLSVVGGLLNLPFRSLEFLTSWLDPIFEETPGFHHIEPTSFGSGFLLSTVAVVLAVTGIVVAQRLYDRYSGRDPLVERLGSAASFLERGWRVDRLYEVAVVEPGRRGLDWLNRFFDVGIVDGAVNGVARLLQLGGEETRRVQSGHLRRYVLAVFAGTAVLILFALTRSTL